MPTPENPPPWGFDLDRRPLPRKGDDPAPKRRFAAEVRRGNGWSVNVIRAGVAASAPDNGSKGNATKHQLLAGSPPPLPLHSRRLGPLGSRQGQREARCRSLRDGDRRDAREAAS